MASTRGTRLTLIRSSGRRPRRFPPERDLSITLFGQRFDSPIFMCPIGLIGLCAPDFQGDVAAAQASAATGVPFTLSTFTQTRMEDVITHAGDTPTFYQLYL